MRFRFRLTWTPRAPCILLALTLAPLLTASPAAQAGAALPPAPAPAADLAGEPPASLRIGSKRFTESYVLGELLRQQAASGGPALHRGGLGNTAILLAALKSGEIDVYPEYSGTIAREILGRTDLLTPAQFAGPLAAQGLAAAVPLGFEDAYALALAPGTARRYGLSGLADLAHADGLRLAFSQEFLHRADGWPAIAARYGLGTLHPAGMDHGLAYDALRQGAVDVIDAYTTDARLGRDGLQLLADPAQVIPPYQAMLLYRLGTPAAYPAQWRALVRLEGRISAAAMREANARVDLDHASFAAAAAALLAQALGPAPVAAAPIAGPGTGDPDARGTQLAGATRTAQPSTGLGGRVLAALWSRETWNETLQHLALVFGPVTLAALVGIPLGVVAASRRRLAGPLLALVGILQTIPAMALLALLIAVSGRIGMLPALTALFIYALLPILSAAETGIRTIDPALRESAVALGARWSARTWHIELPAARSGILAGVRTAAVINVGGATLAAFVGAGGYGERIVAGLAVNDPALLLAGALPSALLALCVQGVFGQLERHWRP